MKLKALVNIAMYANVAAHLLVSAVLFYNIETIGTHIAQESNALILHVEFATALMAIAYFFWAFCTHVPKRGRLSV